MTTLWFATPAWRRFETVAICLEQRNRVIDVLAEHGIEGHQVVVADDENLDIARGLGCSVVERDNEMLGRRFNDGIEYAGRQGADWIVQINSDSWIDPAFFLPLTEPEETLTSEAYCMVTSDRLYELRVSPLDLDQAAGPYVFHRSLLEPCGFRPSEDETIMTDTSIVEGIRHHRPINWKTRTLHPFQYVGFRYPPVITPLAWLLENWLVAEHDPWTTLAEHYPVDLVERMRRNMEGTVDATRRPGP